MGKHDDGLSLEDHMKICDLCKSAYDQCGKLINMANGARLMNFIGSRLITKEVL